MSAPQVSQRPSGLSRRGAIAAVAAAAAGAGALMGWQRFRLSDPQDMTTFWASRFPTHDGGALTLASLKGRPLLLNFWATWCPPCVDELPLLNSFYAENKSNGWQLLGLAVDKPEPVARFLARSPLAFPVGLAGLEGVDLARELGNSAGGLPFSVLFDAAGQLRDRKLGQLHPSDLARWRQLLGPA
ncbi:TlpA disulfide reductase family protein [Ottowia sp.]|uniref:TlpA family protein disulfide reductase n=1 Tax=Ottowia sp. TaxID=1898956 RepID=UPI002C8C6356|nr:TlpA disulfide reductase family protein [Ottowia sp.]HOB67772.1 TlpA disulfide reductase family protein [Ottowia sp.]HPZ56811.1 TlpA disulfide reductase family protein [Ottowia sp.]HQD48726.1 TlpA disulfide reductase family protein [Ottowia sp.]